MIRRSFADTAVAVLGSCLNPEPRASVAKCRCGEILDFGTDAIGRTVERCDGCHYRGAVRRVASTTIAKRRRPPSRPFQPRDPRYFRCGHSRTSGNAYQNPRGWQECRICAKARSRKAGRAVA